MADWGLYAALRGTDDWQTKRADALMNLQAAEKRQAFEAEKEKEAIKYDEYMAQYTAAMEQLDVLQEDQGRVQEAEQRARQDVYDKLAKADGDVRKFMAMGGASVMNAYTSKVLQSEEVQQAAVNKQNLAYYAQAQAKGNQYVFDVEVDIPGVDKDGNETTQTKKVSFEEALRLFQDGKISKLPWNGSENKLVIDPNKFKSTYRDHTDPYSQDNVVRQSHVLEYGLGAGASQEQAYKTAERYGEVVKNGGDVMRWGAADPYQLDYQYDQLNARIEQSNLSTEDKRRMFEIQSQMQYMQQQRAYEVAMAKARAAGDGSSSKQYANAFRTRLNARVTEGQQMSMMSGEREFWMKLPQFGFDKIDAADTNYQGGTGHKANGTAVIFPVTASGGPARIDENADPLEVQMNGYEVASFGSKVGYTMHKGVTYVGYEVYIPSDQMPEHNGRTWDDDESPYRNAISDDKYSDKKGDNEANRVMVWKPIAGYEGSVVDDDYQMAEMNMAVGIKTGEHEWQPASESREDAQNRMINKAVQIYKQTYNEDPQSFDDIIGIYNQISQSAGGSMYGRWDPNFQYGYGDFY
jgi:hypothetical protein